MDSNPQRLTGLEPEQQMQVGLEPTQARTWLTPRVTHIYSVFGSTLCPPQFKRVQVAEKNVRKTLTFCMPWLSCLSPALHFCESQSGQEITDLGGTSKCWNNLHETWVIVNYFLYLKAGKQNGDSIDQETALLTQSMQSFYIFLIV